VDLVGASNRNSPSHACGSASGKHVEPDADKYGYVHGHHDRRVRRLLALASSSFFFQGPQRLDGTVWRSASMSSPPTEPTRPPTHAPTQPAPDPHTTDPVPARAHQSTDGVVDVVRATHKAHTDTGVI
jgi:hypothetical protein